MLVIRDDPQIDLLVKIAYGPCWGGTIASEVRKNELGHWEEVCMSEVSMSEVSMGEVLMNKFGNFAHWEEKDVFFPTSCPAEVNLSVPDQITVDYPDDDRRLVALGVGDYLTLGDAAFAGVEVKRFCGGHLRGGCFFTVLALSSARSGALPGADCSLLDLEWDDSMTWVMTYNVTSTEKLQPVRVSANEIIFQDENGGEVIFERQQYRVAIRRGRSEPITGYLWMVKKHAWAGIELRRRRSRGKKFWGKQPDFLQFGFLRARQWF
jgi:hypothetical protein